MAEGLVLDAWPILEWLQGNEPATSLLDELLDGCLRGNGRLLMSRMNYAEVVYNCLRHFPERRASFLADVQALPIDVLPVDDALIDEAAALKAVYPISFGDCFAAALAMRFGLPVVTGDLKFRRLEVDGLVQLYWVGA